MTTKLFGMLTLNVLVVKRILWNITVVRVLFISHNDVINWKSHHICTAQICSPSSSRLRLAICLREIVTAIDNNSLKWQSCQNEFFFSVLNFFFFFRSFSFCVSITKFSRSKSSRSAKILVESIPKSWYNYAMDNFLKEMKS